jgi:MYXO-CTERM domain-containing protein
MDKSFTSGGDALLAALPRGSSARHVPFNSAGADGVRRDLQAFLNSGTGIVEYYGHGSVDVWADGLLDRAYAETLATVTHPGIFVPLTCLNGFFQDVYTESLAETLMKLPTGGALAVWASSGLTFPEEQAAADKQLVRQLLGGAPSLGEAVLAAKASAGQDIRRTWILFGDPSMRLPPAVDPDDQPSDPTAGNPSTEGQDGCGCRLGSSGSSGASAAALFPLLFLGLIAALRRRPRRAR